MAYYDSVQLDSCSSSGLQLPQNLGSYYTIPANQAINEVESFRVKSVNVPRTYYNITTGSLVFGLNGSTSNHQNLTVPAGNYSASQLASYIQTAWLALTGTVITVDFSQPTFKLNITRVSGTDATIAISATELALAGMGSMLGFFSTIGATTLLVASNSFWLGGPRKISVISNVLAAGMGGKNLISQSILHNGQDGQYVRSSSIIQLSSAGNQGDSSLTYIPTDHFRFLGLQNINKLDFGLVDENGASINLNGFAWQISLEFRQKKNI